jgi:hypothetical protein
MEGEGRGAREDGKGKGTYCFEVGFLDADIEEPEVLIELDLGGHVELLRELLG